MVQRWRLPQCAQKRPRGWFVNNPRLRGQPPALVSASAVVALAGAETGVVVGVPVVTLLVAVAVVAVAVAVAVAVVVAVALAVRMLMLVPVLVPVLVLVWPIHKRPLHCPPRHPREQHPWALRPRGPLLQRRRPWLVVLGHLAVLAARCTTLVL